MPWYIEVDAFRHRIHCQPKKMSVNEVLELVSTMPSADVAEVVRCKDCKHSVKHQLGYGCGMNYHLATNGNWFCADGERRK